MTQQDKAENDFIRTHLLMAKRNDKKSESSLLIMTKMEFWKKNGFLIKSLKY